VAYPRLRRIDLSNNEISSIAPDAFRNLKSLTSLVLYGNKITHLSSRLFDGLSSLQLLLINANKIECIKPDTFSGLASLNLLSLFLEVSPDHFTYQSWLLWQLEIRFLM